MAESIYSGKTPQKMVELYNDEARARGLPSWTNENSSVSQIANAIENLKRETFTDRIIEELSRIIKLPADADIARFGANVRDAARQYNITKNQLSSAELKSRIERLYLLTTRAASGNDQAVQELIRAIHYVPAELWQWLSTWDTNAEPTADHSSTGKKLAQEVLSPETRQVALRKLHGLLSFGAHIEPGRKRDGGRRSQSVRPHLRAPRTTRGRPRDVAKVEFIYWLSVAYLDATGKPPPYTVNYSKKIRGPFPSFVCRCFELVGAPTGNIDRLINEFGRERKNSHSMKGTRSWSETSSSPSGSS